MQISRSGGPNVPSTTKPRYHVLPSRQASPQKKHNPDKIQTPHTKKEVVASRWWWCPPDHNLLFSCTTTEPEQHSRYSNQATDWSTETSQHGQKYFSSPYRAALALFNGRWGYFRGGKAAEAYSKSLSCHAEIWNTRSHTSVLMWLLMARTTGPITMLPLRHQ